MDISNWSLEKIMQLPDFCFGARFPLSITEGGIKAESFLMHPRKLPDRFVLWEICTKCTFQTTFDWATWQLAMGHRRPGSEQEFEQLESLLPEPYETLAGHNVLAIGYIQEFRLPNLRMPFIASGRRFVVRTVQIGTSVVYASVTIVISSIPDSIPDYFNNPMMNSIDHSLRQIEIIERARR